MPYKFNPIEGILDRVEDAPSISTQEVFSYANLAAFPVTGAGNTLYIANDTGLLYAWNGTTYVVTTDDNVEFIQDTIGGSLIDTPTIDLTYDDVNGQIKADVNDDSITFAKMQEIPTMTFLGNIAALTANPTAVESVQMFVGVPLNSSASGEQGQFSYDANYFYYHNGTKWNRVSNDLTIW